VDGSVNSEFWLVGPDALDWTVGFGLVAPDCADGGKTDVGKFVVESCTLKGAASDIENVGFETVDNGNKIVEVDPKRDRVVAGLSDVQ